MADLPAEVETCQSSLPHSEVWKQPMCKACESCFGAKKGVISFCMCSKARFPVCLGMTAWLEEGGQERWCFRMSPLGYLLCSHPPGQSPGLWRRYSGTAYMVPVLQCDCSSPNILCFSDVLGRLPWALALYKRGGASLYFLKASNSPCSETEVSLTGACLRQALLSPGEDWRDIQEPS